MTDLFSRIQHTSFFTLLATVSFGFLFLISDFILPIIWAVVLAIIFYPLCARLTHAFGGRSTPAALVTMVAAILLVFTPITLAGVLIAQESTDLYHDALSLDVNVYERTISAVPFAQEALNMANIQTSELPVKIATTLKSVGGGLTLEVVEAGTQTIRFIAKMLVMLYLLFFFLRDGVRFGTTIMRVLPLGDAKEIFLFERFSTTVRATIKGTLVVALVQGAIGSILFALAGIHSPVLWGIVMALFALVPGIGPAIVWVPAALIMFALGHTGATILIAVGGIAVIGTIDNILRPLLMGRDTDMPDALILLSVLGGLGTFGLSGVILGPAIAALFLASWQLFEEQYKTQLVERG
ncbi:AI-2E family transporter [Candidatus Kaiserbacteria bacterium]|nr:AI-2E family transporter [Candidatus Kaiserbacteria bacterium]